MPVYLGFFAGGQKICSLHSLVLASCLLCLKLATGTKEILLSFVLYCQNICYKYLEAMEPWWVFELRCLAVHAWKFSYDCRQMNQILIQIRNALLIPKIAVNFRHLQVAALPWIQTSDRHVAEPGNCVRSINVVCPHFTAELKWRIFSFVRQADLNTETYWNTGFLCRTFYTP